MLRVSARAARSLYYSSKYVLRPYISMVADHESRGCCMALPYHWMWLKLRDFDMHGSRRRQTLRRTEAVELRRSWLAGQVLAALCPSEFFVLIPDFHRRFFCGEFSSIK